MKESPLLNKSFDFATKIVVFYEYFSKNKNVLPIAKQLLRSGTSVGANINEAIYGSSKADFTAKLYIALKEVNESIYWLRLINHTKISDYDLTELLTLAEEIKKCWLWQQKLQKKIWKSKKIINFKKSSQKLPLTVVSVL